MIIIESMIFIIITLLIVSAIYKHDKEIKLAFTKKDIILISITSFFSSVVINYKYNQLNEIHIIISVLTLLMLIMSYIVLKTMRVYTVLDITAIVTSMIYAISNIEILNTYLKIYPNNLIIAISILVLAVLFFTQGVELGDTLLYIALLIYYSTKSQFGGIIFIITVLVSNIAFLLINGIKFIKDRKRKLLLVPYILLAWLILC